MSLLNQIRMEDLDDELRELCEVIGIEAFVLLVQAYSGTSIYIPKVESLEKIIRDEKIKEEFNGTNYRELARKYGLSEVWIRNLTNEKAEKLKREPIPGQINLMDFLNERAEEN